MAFNVSQRKRRTVAMGNVLGDLHGWYFDLACRKCGRTSIVPTNRLPQQLKVSEVLGRLRCQDCRQPPARALICNGQSGRRTWQVPLKGPGAFG